MALNISENLPFKKNAVGVVLFVAAVFAATVAIAKTREIVAGMKKGGN